VACSVSKPCIVRIQAGNFTLATGFTLASGVVVRGAGANQTVLTVNAQTGGDNCGYFYQAAIAICGHPPNDDSANWTAGYAKGTTTITLDNRNELVPGKTPIFLNQLNEATDGFPTAGDIYICDDAGGCSSAGGGACRLGGAGVCGRASTQVVMVT